MVGLVVHEWAEKSGGAEKVIDEFLQLYPDSELQLLWNDAGDRFKGHRVHETWLAQTKLRQKKSLAVPFLPFTWRNLKPNKAYDWLLVSSHLFAHHIKFRASEQPPKLVYAHTPARYIWEPSLDTRGNTLLARSASKILKPLDRKRAQEAVSIAANSEFTAKRINRVWERDAEVIYPPVEVSRLQISHSWAENIVDPEELKTIESLPADFVLGASRLVPYKRVDLAIQVGESVGLPVVIAGSGPDISRLRAVAQEAKVPVVFINSPSDNLLRALYEKTLAYVFGSVEDFGIMPVEAMALGAPVIGSGAGGTLETVIPGISGSHFIDETQSALRHAFDEAVSCKAGTIKSHAHKFSAENFRSNIDLWKTKELAKLGGSCSSEAK